jgi:hypothetical protein
LWRGLSTRNLSTRDTGATGLVLEKMSRRCSVCEDAWPSAT